VHIKNEATVSHFNEWNFWHNGNSWNTHLSNAKISNEDISKIDKAVMYQMPIHQTVNILK
jgi:hypothetical protein